MKRLFRLLTWIPRTLWKVLRHRYRQIALAVIVLAMIGTMGMLYYRHSVKTEGSARLVATLAELDATDPGWRLAQPAQFSLPEGENSAYLLKQFRDSLGSKQIALKDTNGKYLFEDREPNSLLSNKEFEQVDRFLQVHAREREIAKQFHVMPRGQRLTHALDKVSPQLREDTTAYEVGVMLEAEAFFQTQNGRLGKAILSAISLVHLAHSMEGDVLLVEMLTKLSNLRKSVRCTEHLLAMGETKSSHLEKLQSLLLASSQEDLFKPAIRGERAYAIRVFAEKAIRIFDKEPEEFSFSEYYSNWNRSWHKYHMIDSLLHLYTDALSISDLPEAEAQKRIKQLEPTFYSSSLVLSRIVYPTLKNFHISTLNTKATLRTASTAIAVERYRIKTGRWPESLQEIPAEILSSIPKDPFDGQPLRYLMAPDGPKVYSIGKDKRDDGGRIRELTNEATPDDAGFQLYHIALRGKLPPVDPFEDLPRQEIIAPDGTTLPSISITMDDLILGELDEDGKQYAPMPREVDLRR